MHDLSWWSLALSILALVLMIPASILANFLTPTFVSWFLSRNKKSLDKRIAMLEQRLAELKKYPTISEAEDHILWGITQLKIRMSNLATMVFVVAFGALTLVDSHSTALAAFSPILLLIVASDIFVTVRLRYEKGFRYQRSPNVREGLQKSISELKDIQKNWAA